MIADTLAQHSRYHILSPHFAAAFKFLENLPAQPQLGRHDLDGDNCFALVQTYTSKPLAAAKFEAHRKYLDIQYIQSGCETILWTPLTGLTQVTEPYVAERDIAFFATPPQWTPLQLCAGQFAIFCPEDGHAPGVEYDGPVNVLKTVIKIRV